MRATDEEDPWPYTPLAKVTTRIGSGLTPTGGSSVYRPVGRPFVRSQNVGWGELKLAGIAYIDEQTHAKFMGSEIRAGDVLLNITGASIGRSAVATPELDGGNVNQHVCEIRLDGRKMDPYFVSAFLLSRRGQDQIDAFQAGGNRQGLNFQQVGAIRIPAPPLAVQKSIGRAATDADRLIAAIDALLFKKQAMKDGMMQQLLTGTTRLPGFSQPWVDVRLGDHVTFVKNVALSRSQLDTTSPLRYLHYGDIHTSPEVVLAAAEAPMPRVPRALVRSAGRLQVGDLVFADASEDPDGVGRSVEVISVPPDGVISGLHTIAARFDKSVLADGFKGYLQFVPAFRRALLRLAAGTKVLATTRSFIASVTLTLPRAEEQQAIAVSIFDADAEIRLLRSRLVKAQAVKQGMMQELLTGSTRLPVEVEA